MMSRSSQLANEETLSEGPQRKAKNRGGCAMLQLLFVMNLLFTSWPNSVAGKCKAIISVAKNGQVCYVEPSLGVFGLISTCSGRRERGRLVRVVCCKSRIVDVQVDDSRAQ